MSKATDKLDRHGGSPSIGVREADRRAARSNAQSGLKMTEDDTRLRENVLRGTMTEAQFREAIIAKVRSD